MREVLCRNGYAVPRSYANFLYLPGGDSADRLTRAGIVAKRFPDGSARVAVGDPASDAAVCAALCAA
jgi:histidinol-phosphate aminotransferase